MSDSPSTEPSPETKAVLRMSADSERMAIQANNESLHKFEHAPPSLARSALFALSLDSIRVSQAVFDTCDSGWSGEAASMVRTLMDLMISTFALTGSEDGELAAFRYFYSSYRAGIRDPRNSKELRSWLHGACQNALNLLPAASKPQALRFLHNERALAYWYAGEFKKPAAVLERFAPPPIVEGYRALSAAAHGGFVGIRMFRDDPDSRDIEPRKPGPSAEYLLIMSTRILLEQTRVRCVYEGLASLDDVKKVYADALEEVRRRFGGARP